jgi:hypothetical protein
MPLSKGKRLAILKASELKSQEISSSEDAQNFQKDYNEIITELNEKIENRLDSFTSEAIPILREAYPSRPSGILVVIKEEVDRIRGLAQEAMTNLEVIKYAPFRQCASECIKDIVDICTESIIKQCIKADLRAGVKQQ